jgi:hypothetical protein
MNLGSKGSCLEIQRSNTIAVRLSLAITTDKVRQRTEVVYLSGDFE